MASDALPDELLDRVQQLTAEVDALPDPHARELAQELVGAVIAMYGDGLRADRRDDRGLARGRRDDPRSARPGRRGREPAADPRPVPGLARGAGDSRRSTPSGRTWSPTAATSSCSAIEDGVAQLALQGSCNGCAASRATLELAIKQALDEHAPDLVGLEVEGVTRAGATRAGDGRFELPMVHSGADRRRRPEPAPARWIPLDGIERASNPGSLPRARAPTATTLLLAQRQRVRCSPTGTRAPPAARRCTTASSTARMLRCAHCGVEFDLPRAGRAAGGEPLQLTPVPLLEIGGVRVAV